MKKTVYKKDLTNKKIYVTREFDAPVSEVWRAWTESDLLDQWWAPKPWKANTKSMDFREGGSWLYSMNGPEGEQHWAKAEFIAIVPEKSYEGLDSFCDEHGNINNDLPRMNWKVNFIPEGDVTKVDIEITFPSEEDLNKIVEMGFQEGFEAAHGNLDDLLAQLRN